MRTKTIAAGLVSICAFVLAATPAYAEGPAGGGSVGSAHGLVDGQPIDIQDLAACTVGGASTASTDGATAGDFVKFGTGRSACRRNDAGAAEVQVTGRKFKLDLGRWGGPVIKMSSFSVGCGTTGNGSQASITVSGLSGMQVPNPIPANHTVTIPGTEPNSPPVARIVIHEVITPDPPDGSLTVNLMHVTLFPDGMAIHSGHVVVGSVSCSPDPD
jgi:hypothetical protein